MENLKGYKTIIFMIITALMGAVDSISEMVNIPEWYYLYIVPVVGTILRFLTTTPVGKKG